jgi:hypothetical protein
LWRRSAREIYHARTQRETGGHHSGRGRVPCRAQYLRFEFKPGWKIDFKKDEKGKITGATWTGRIVPYEFVEFGMLGINPKEATTLVWKFVQYYEDGSKEEFTGPVGSRLPSPVTTLRMPETTTSASK